MKKILFMLGTCVFAPFIEESVGMIVSPVLMIEADCYFKNEKKIIDSKLQDIKDPEVDMRELSKKKESTAEILLSLNKIHTWLAREINFLVPDHSESITLRMHIVNNILPQYNRDLAGFRTTLNEITTTDELLVFFVTLTQHADAALDTWNTILHHRMRQYERFDINLASFFSMERFVSSLFQ